MDDGNIHCFVCLEQLPKDGDYVYCNGNCQGRYHYGCTTIKKTTYKQMSSEKKNAWKCVNCRQENVDRSEELYNRLSNLLEKKLTVIDDLRKEILDLKINVKESVARQEELLEKYNVLQTKVEQSESKILLLNTELETIKSENKRKDREIQALSKQVNFIEGKEISNAIEICGVSKNTGENLETIFSKITEKLNLCEIKGNVLSINRAIVKEENKLPPPIIVKFNNTKDKELLIERKKKVLIKNQEIVENSEEQNYKIFINECLTSYKKNLFWKTKNKAKELKYKFVWIKHNNIYVKKAENERVLKIKSTEDLNNII